MSAKFVEVSVADAITQCLMREGIDSVFGIPSGHLLTLLNTFRRSGMRSIEARHEGAATCMAAGYAQASGRVGVTYVQTGPGTSNAITGIAGGFMDSVPMLLLPAQVARNDFAFDAHQEASGLTKSFDQLDMFRGMSHFTARPSTPENTVRMVRMALRTAIALRGPTVVEMPADLPSQKVQFQDLLPSEYRAQSAPVDAYGVDYVCKALHTARRPVIIVGDRLCHVGVAKEIVAFCEEQQIACATVNYAKGIIPEDHPLFVGIVNQTGHESASEYLMASDLLITLGVRMNIATTSRRLDLFPNIIQIDNDPREIGRVMPVRFGFTGDLAGTVRALRASASKPPGPRETESIVAELKKKHATYDEPAGRVDTAVMTPPRAMRILREHLPRETLMVGDTGTTQVSLSRHFPAYASDGYFALYALAPMGSGLPIALGVQIARPEATVVSVLGDGGFLTHVGELSVAAQHDLPVIVVVINNGTYKSISDRQEMFFGKTFGVDIRSPDHAKLAESFGCDGVQARSGPELRAAIDKALSRRRPTVIEVPVDPSYKEYSTMSEHALAAQKKIWSSQTEEWPFEPIPKNPRPV